MIRQEFTDPTTLLPVVGYIKFFKTDKITIKNFYQQTGNPSTPFQVAPNPTNLDTAGGISFVPYLYPYDETDEDTEELYYIEVRRTADDSLVFTFDNFPENFDQSGGNTTIENVINKCPSYGFDNPVMGTNYTEDNENPVQNPWNDDPILA
ncbi:MAG: hypothetical protein R3206_10595, partial [Salegentibacter mishustinae]|nr:hypothetical protein [Salegentibacter mishustinae]